MPVNVIRLRYWFAASAVLAVLVVAGFFFYARYRLHSAIREVPQKLGVEIQQSTDSFSLSKSEGGRTIFTVQASKAVQYKQGGRAELHDVSIVVYGRESNRYDRIYGADFEYDPQTGDVIAKGEVHIDLEGSGVGEIAPGQAPPPDLQNPIHLKTVGLTFNQKTGIAKTDGQIEFRIPDANGAAVGATYDSKSNSLTLGSDVRLETTGRQAATVNASHGVLTRDPRRAVLNGVHLSRGDSEVLASNATLFLRDDNSIDHILATGDVRASSQGANAFSARAPIGEFAMGPKNTLRSAIMRGGVVFVGSGANALNGNAGRVTMDFGDDAKLVKVRATEGVHLLQRPSPQSASTSGPRIVAAKMKNGVSSPAEASSDSSRNTVELTAGAVDFYVRGGHFLDRAETSGAAQIVVAPEKATDPQERTVVTAGKFNAGFANGRLASVHGAPEARVVQSSPGQPEKVSTSDTLDAVFGASGGIGGFVQQGHFKYTESSPDKKINRSATAERATYSNSSQILTLVGTPSVTDGGMTATAKTIRLNRRTGDAEAENDVKTTYNELRPQSSGAMLASGDPVHVTAANMVVKRTSGIAQYSGGARLWQNANIVQAPIIVFDRDKRALHAEGTSGRQVDTMFVQQDSTGKMTPITVRADRLDYVDPQRKARFDGSVVMRSADGTVSARQLDVWLKPGQAEGQKRTVASSAKTEASPAINGMSGKLDRAVAEGHVVLQQPTRRGAGEKLVYLADEGKFVLTGGHPSIYDAERGTITGASLTFYNRDDRVLVEGGSHDRTVTKTRVSK